MFGTALWACPPRALPSLLAALRALTLHVPPSLQLACARPLADLHIRNRPGPAGRMERDGQVTLDEREFVQAEPAAGHSTSSPVGNKDTGKGNCTARSGQHPPKKAPLFAAGGTAMGSAKGNCTTCSLQYPSKKVPLFAAGGSAVGTANGNCTARSL